MKRGKIKIMIDDKPVDLKFSTSLKLKEGKGFCVQYSEGFLGAKYYYSRDFPTFTKAYEFMQRLDPKWKYKNIQCYSEDGNFRFFINPDYYQECLDKEKK